MTPFQALYVYPSPGVSSNHPVDQTLHTRDQILKVLKENLEVARNRMKMQADKHRSERKFKDRDWVYLCLRPDKVLKLHD